MSNDLKFWIARLSMFAFIALGFFVLIKAWGSFEPGRPHGSTALWVAFFAIAVLGTAAAVFYYYFKAARWQDLDDQSVSDKVALETLAKLAQQRESEKEQEDGS